VVYIHTSVCVGGCETGICREVLCVRGWGGGGSTALNKFVVRMWGRGSVMTREGMLVQRQAVTDASVLMGLCVWVRVSMQRQAKNAFVTSSLFR